MRSEPTLGSASLDARQVLSVRSRPKGVVAKDRVINHSSSTLYFSRACGTRFPRELSLAKICPARAFLACPPQAPRSYLMFFNRLSMPATACSVLN